jgi:hypothetical protein
LISLFFVTVSSSKDFGIRASNQLNTLRTLLETRLMEQDDRNHYQNKDLSILQSSSSPGTSTKEFLQSYKYKNQSTEFISDLDDDDEENQRMKINKDKYQGDVVSTSTISTNRNESSLTDEINQKKIHSNVTITSNFTPKIDTRK